MGNYWKWIDYNTYLDYCETIKILEKQKALVLQKEMIAVLDTSLFSLVDYFGNQNGYYDCLFDS